jgi:GWxTD domain-containing protein
MHRLLAVFVLLIISTVRAVALDAVVAHTTFYLPDPLHANMLTPSVETYWQINPQTIRYTTIPEKGIVARIKTVITFSSAAGILKEDEFILQTVPRANVTELMAQSIRDLRRYFLQPGKVTLRLQLTDLADTTNKYSYTDTITLASVPNTAFFSSPQLLDTTLNVAVASPFKKNGVQMLPSSTNFLDNNRNYLHYYAELYQANEISNLDYPLAVRVTISKKEDEAHYHTYIKTDSITPAAMLPVSGSFNIESLPSGNYYLNVSLGNNVHHTVASTTLFFQRMNTRPPKMDTTTVVSTRPNRDTAIENIKVLDLDKTFLSKYNLGEIRAILKMLLPVSDFAGTQAINNFLKKPDDLYMRYYIYNYFQNLNKRDPAKAWKEYTARIMEVNKLFKGSGQPGYETERGYMYLRYGAPTDVVTVQNESGVLPYEVWQYNVLTQKNGKDITNAVFLFYKPNQMIADFRLLHCNVAGEQQNPAWRSYLYVNGTGGNSLNSRAEQYLGN